MEEMVKPPLKNRQKKMHVLNTGSSLVQVESIAECSTGSGAYCNTF